MPTYGSDHERLREQWRPIVDTGTVDCWRCEELIEPGTPWDLGHNDLDPSRYEGPEHRRCNRSAGATKGLHLRRVRAAAADYQRRAW